MRPLRDEFWESVFCAPLEEGHQLGDAPDLCGSVEELTHHRAPAASAESPCARIRRMERAQAFEAISRVSGRPPGGHRPFQAQRSRALRHSYPSLGRRPEIGHRRLRGGSLRAARSFVTALVN